MTGRERLIAVQEKLKAQGVRDVKFTWGPDAHKLTHDELCGQVADWLEAMLRGEYEEMEFAHDGSDRLVPKRHGGDASGQ